MSSLLRLESVSKSFTGTRALDDVSLTVEAGEIRALLGANGAGKSTLIKIMAGVESVDSGRILIDGSEAVGGDSRIAFVHQDLGLIEDMTVAENVAIARGYARSSGLIKWGAVRDRAASILDIMAVDVDPDAPIASLSRADKSLVAIARAAGGDPKILVLDEPTASLPVADVSSMFDVLRLLADRGVGMIFVSHRLDEVFEIAHSVTVLRDGRKVDEERVSDVDMRRLITGIVGREHTTYRSPDTNAGDVVLQARQLGTDVSGPVDLAFRAGEIVGLIGLRGGGQESIGRALAGAVPGASGSVDVAGSLVTKPSPKAMLDRGVAFVTSKREDESLAPTLTIAENMFINPAGTKRRWHEFQSPRAEVTRARNLIEDFGIKAPDPEAGILTLSGGNQQKVVIARQLTTHPKVLIAEEPTMGVDVGSKSEIYAQLGDAVKGGCCVVVIATDLDEVAAICHRAIVFSRGRVVEHIDREGLTVPNLTRAVEGDASQGRPDPNKKAETA